MSTAPENAKLIAIGMRHRTSYLVQQAGFSLGIAAAEGEPLAALLPKGHLDKTTQLRDDVAKTAQDKTVAAAEAKQTTMAQNEHIRSPTVWIRKVGKRCQSAVQLGVALPPDLTRTSSPITVPGMLEHMNKTVALLGQHSAAMDAVGPATQPLIDQGRTLQQSLQQADTALSPFCARSPARFFCAGGGCTCAGEADQRAGTRHLRHSATGQHEQRAGDADQCTGARQLRHRAA